LFDFKVRKYKGLARGKQEKPLPNSRQKKRGGGKKF